MFDETKILILINGEDKTKEIENYEYIEDEKIKITFINGHKEYNYYKYKVSIYENSYKIDLKKFRIYKNSKPLLKITTALGFQNIIKVFFKNHETKIYPLNELEIIDANHQEKNLDILDYFKDISQYLKDEDEDKKDNKKKKDKTFLEEQYDNLDNISPESVLHTYLNKKELKTREIDLSNLIFPFAFNKSQKEAIKSVLEKNIGIIEGPPGTGKTQTILNILANLAVLENKKIAVVSNNNEATKNVFEKMEKAGYSFIIANLGRYEKRQEFFTNLPKIKIDNFKHQENIEYLFEENKKLNKKLDYFLDIIKEKAIIEKQITDYTLEQKYYENYLNSQNIKDIEFTTNLDENKILQIIFSLQFLSNKIFLCKPLFNFIYSHKYKLKNLRKNKLNYLLKLQKEFYILKLKNLNESVKQINAELKNANFEEIQNRQKEISEKIFQYKLYERYKDNQRNFTYDNYLNEFNAFIENFPIVLSTTHSLRKSIPNNFLFDYIIIDESSQVDLVAGSLSLSVAKNAIIVGDEKQLPQIVKLEIKPNLINPNVNEEFDYFTNNILSSISKIYENKVPKKTLVEHYRCHPKIIEFSNKRYYSGQLISYPSDEHRTIDKPLILYYTTEGHHMNKVTNGNKEDKGTYNQRELDVIKEEVLKNNNISIYKDKDIGITAPYRLQANKMAAINKNIQSDTIHKYQGKEKKLIILSTVLDDSWNGKRSLRFVDDAHMINVAVSRAINQFVLVTHNKMFLKNGQEINALLKYIQYQSMDSEILESKLVSVFDLLYKDYSQKLNELNKRLLNRLKYKSENIIDTILYTEFKKDEYKDFSYTKQVFLKNQFKDLTAFSEKERKFINNLSSFDFVIYDAMNNYPKLIIEVDGFKFHENNPIQLHRDKIKNGICQKVNIPIIRLKTNHTYSEEDIINIIKQFLFKQ